MTRPTGDGSAEAIPMGVAVLSALAITGATPGGPKSVLPPPDIVKLFADPNPDVNKLLDVVFSPSGADAQRRFIADFVKVPQPPSSPHAAEKYDAAEKNYWAEPEPKLDAITVPVLVMNGADDYAVPPQTRGTSPRASGRTRDSNSTPEAVTAGSSSTPPTSTRSSRTSSAERLLIARRSSLRHPASSTRVNARELNEHPTRLLE